MNNPRPVLPLILGAAFILFVWLVIGGIGWSIWWLISGGLFELIEAIKS